MYGGDVTDVPVCFVGIINMAWWWSDICSGDNRSGDDISDNKDLEWG